MKEYSMRTVQNIDNVTIKVSKDELINEKWLTFQLLSRKLAEIEEDRKIGYKKLRNKMYNSQACSKYNSEIVAGMKCIDVTNPMKGIASLEFTFEVA